ncbi:hypothetical protein AWB82_06237 [Caballeronia glebae]|uniref:Uncharacterized protein n=1 Tax=Caballeronia glebae TaxID=1777143 RepID=A0A158D3K4_9BURK|nr:hypothetical protein [Caballeronia glebae]SAK89178.1 hypothetical protein AWB82_06237 [Caballeronia glebae]
MTNSLRLERAVARDADWQVNYPALAMASTIDAVDERRRQIVVAAADETALRAEFFGSLGAILDFQATWDELDTSAKGGSLSPSVGIGGGYRMLIMRGGSSGTRSSQPTSASQTGTLQRLRVALPLFGNTSMSLSTTIAATIRVHAYFSQRT